MYQIGIVAVYLTESNKQKHKTIRKYRITFWNLIKNQHEYLYVNADHIQNAAGEGTRIALRFLHIKLEAA